MTELENLEMPNPGSNEAISLGCTCPVLDNGHGDEDLGRIRGFYITHGCPVHHPLESQQKRGEG